MADSTGTPLRVLYSFPHTIGAPGIGTTALHQVKALRDMGIDVQVLCTSVAVDAGVPGGVTATLTVAGRRIPHRAVGVRRAYDYHDARVARFLARRADRFDVVHTWPTACLRTLRAARRTGVVGLREVPSAHTGRAVSDAAAAAASVGVELPVGHSHRPDEQHLRRELKEFEAAAGLLVPSDYVARTFVEEGFDEERLFRHQYGFDEARFVPRVAGRDRPFTAVFVGRGEPNKGLHLALGAWAASGAGRDGRFLICGRIMAGYRSVIGPLLAQPGVEELGFVDGVERILADADVLVLPTATEGSALVTYEAQGSGCILVVSDAAGAVCRHGESGLVHAYGDVDELTSHLRMLHADPALRARMRAATLALRPSLTWRAAGASLVEAYRSAVSSLAVPAVG